MYTFFKATRLYVVEQGSELQSVRLQSHRWVTVAEPRGLKCHLLLLHLNQEAAQGGRTQGLPEGEAARTGHFSLWSQASHTGCRSEAEELGIDPVTGEKERETPWAQFGKLPGRKGASH